MPNNFKIVCFTTVQCVVTQRSSQQTPFEQSNINLIHEILALESECYQQTHLGCCCQIPYLFDNNRPGQLLNFWTLEVGAYSRWALIRGWVLIKFSPFSASEVCLFCNKTINATNKMRRSNKARFL